MLQENIPRLTVNLATYRNWGRIKTRVDDKTVAQEAKVQKALQSEDAAARRKQQEAVDRMKSGKEGAAGAAAQVAAATETGLDLDSVDSDEERRKADMSGVADMV